MIMLLLTVRMVVVVPVLGYCHVGSEDAKIGGKQKGQIRHIRH